VFKEPSSEEIQGILVKLHKLSCSSPNIGRQSASYRLEKIFKHPLDTGWLKYIIITSYPLGVTSITSNHFSVSFQNVKHDLIANTSWQTNILW
jgi:hypothetical protein